MGHSKPSVDIDDVEEANLSEYSGSPTKNQCDRYSDLKGGERRTSQISDRERSNSNNNSATA